jgi:hypothetical protein
MSMNITIPWTAFSFFVFRRDGSNLVAAPSLTENGTPYGTPGKKGTSESFGSTRFYCPQAGTYKFTVIYWLQFDQGIARFTITDSNTNVQNIRDIDTYGPGSPKEPISFVWSVSLSAGNHTIALTTNGKNASSTDFWLNFIAPGILVNGPI